MAKLGTWWKERKSKSKGSKPSLGGNEETEASLSPQRSTAAASEPKVQELTNISNPNPSDTSNTPPLSNFETPKGLEDISSHSNGHAKQDSRKLTELDQREATFKGDSSRRTLKATSFQDIILGGGASPPAENVQSFTDTSSGGPPLVLSLATNESITSQDPRSPAMQWAAVPTPPVENVLPVRPRKRFRKYVPPKPKRPPIFGLPKEIIHEIATLRYLDYAGINSLKRTCKTIAKMLEGIPVFAPAQKFKETVLKTTIPEPRLVPPVVKNIGQRPSSPPLEESSVRVPTPPPIKPTPDIKPLEGSIILNFYRPMVRRPNRPPLQLPLAVRPMEPMPVKPPIPKPVVQLPTPPPIILPPILKLPSELVLRIISFLDYPSIIFLKYACKNTIQNLHSYPISKATRQDTLTIRKTFPSKTNFPGSRSPSYWCHRCSDEHSFEHLVIWPHPRSESHFKNFKEYSEQTPRVCVPWAIKKGIWSPGGKMGQNNRYTLCEKCLTPRKISNGKCAWNCQRCGICVRRKIWSGFCVACWKPGDGKVLYGGFEGRSGGSRAYEAEKRGENERICGMCLGRLAYSSGSAELCRCNEARYNSTSNAGW